VDEHPILTEALSDRRSPGGDLRRPTKTEAPMMTPLDTTGLGRSGDDVARALARLEADRIVSRIWEEDHTVWKPDPAGISNRLGWLRVAASMAEETECLERLLADARAQGIENVLLLGMGGSSLAAGVFQEVFGNAEGAPALLVLDSTVPGAVLAAAQLLDPARTLHIVSTKSGTTVETLSLFRFFWKQAVDTLGDEAGDRFVAITDAETAVDGISERLRFRATFQSDAGIGGRYSALSFFGMAPAAVIGVDVAKLLDRSLVAATECGPAVPVGENPGAVLGSVLGACALGGRDKATLLTSPSIEPFADWVEQLIAESTGKEGRGILPVVHEPLGTPAVYGGDRLFVEMRIEGDEERSSALAALRKAGHPVARITIPDPYELGWLFFVWEFATAIAGHQLGINPFDQPDVEGAKARARDAVAEYRASGSFPRVEPAIQDGSITLRGEAPEDTVAGALSAFLSDAVPGDYAALQAYLEPSQETGELLRDLAVAIRERTRLATTAAYGPRFLHSTGQIHKGDAGRGLFIQIEADDPVDAPIPDDIGSDVASVSFGVLKAAQLAGDRRALLERGRRVLTIDLGRDPMGGLRRLVRIVAGRERSG
jgi:glucose-6-phosphate isomerase